MTTTSTIEDTQVLDESQAYANSCSKYEQKADKASVNTNTITVAGFGCKVSVSRKALVVKPGSTHSGNDLEPIVLYPGTHTIKNIVLLADSGSITLDAVEWCVRQKVCITLLDYDGSVLQVLTPEHSSNVALRRKQYSACPLPIVNWLLRAKTAEQVRTLRNHPELDSSKLVNLQRAVASEFMFSDISLLMTEEGRLAVDYFSAFTNYPLKWDKQSLKRIPPHWKVITERSSLLAPNKNGRHATNPYHAILNYALSLLESQVRQEINTVGLDASCGFLHADKNNRDSLIYDLMEPHRAAVDSLVLAFVQKNTLSTGDFIQMKSGNVRLSPQFARYVVTSCRASQTAIAESVKKLMSYL